MTSKNDLQAHKEKKDVKVQQHVEIVVPSGFPFSSVSCQREYENVFKALFQITQPRSDLK